jgi:hypothetical protein
MKYTRIDSLLSTFVVDNSNYVGFSLDIFKKNWGFSPAGMSERGALPAGLDCPWYYLLSFSDGIILFCE